MTNTLDADYETVAAAPAAERGDDRRRRPAGLRSSRSLVAFGVLLGVAALRTEQERPAAEAERAELVDQIHQRPGPARRAAPAARPTSQDQVTSLQASARPTTSTATAGSSQRARRASASSAGTVAVTGPGRGDHRRRRADRPAGTGGVILDTDLQSLVNGLWEAGAEAIAINGHRLTVADVDPLRRARRSPSTTGR